MNLADELRKLQAKAEEELNEIQNMDELEEVRVGYFGKKGQLTKLMKNMGQVPKEDKPEVGKVANEVRTSIQNHLNDIKEKLEQEALNKQLEAEAVDVTLPGRKGRIGHTHVITQVMEELENLFLGMGYEVDDGFELETDEYNFERVNVPKDHPARDMQDSFYVTNELLLRTQTSPSQPRALEVHDFSKGPLKMISPGKVFRRDNDDATHSHQFFQIEGLVVDEHITMADLKGTLELMSKKLFGEEREIRLRPSYFPFTEPSVEVDVSCFNCGGSGCSICKQTGWIEILGAGMVHPEVLEMSGVDSEKYSGFAFGVGADRIAILKYGVDDIRHFYLNDQRFLEQFKVKG